MNNEIWKDIPNYPDYKISSFGRVKSFKLGYEHFLTQLYNKDYFRVRLSKNGKAKNVLVHRLLAENFIPNPENKPCVNHIDGNKLNNVLSNLEWVTRSENSKHAYELQLNSRRGRLNSGNKYDETAVFKIRKLLKEGFRVGQIAKLLDMKHQYISCIKNRKLWDWLEEEDV